MPPMNQRNMPKQAADSNRKTAQKEPSRGQVSNIRELQLDDEALQQFDDVFEDHDDQDLLLNDIEDQDMPGEQIRLESLADSNQMQQQQRQQMYGKNLANSHIGAGS